MERNLRAPLIGIAQQSAAGGQPRGRPSGVRWGTPQAIRRSLLAHPPGHPHHHPVPVPHAHVQAREALRHVNTVIIDEVRAVAGTKRGARLAVSLERLDDLLEEPAQRIGLSAARGTRGHRIASWAARSPWTWCATVQRLGPAPVSVPIPDMTVLGGAATSPSSDGSPTLDGDLGVRAGHGVHLAARGGADRGPRGGPPLHDRVRELPRLAKLTAQLDGIQFRMENAAEQSRSARLRGSRGRGGRAEPPLRGERAARGRGGARPKVRRLRGQGRRHSGHPRRGLRRSQPSRASARRRAAVRRTRGAGLAPDGPGGVARPATGERRPPRSRQSNRHEGASPCWRAPTTARCPRTSAA
ncbi:hypothetical protein QJS66_17250 [Kocuria rhizophila]|nr:hypothetical protein QJS66_17250 [Kocuria rhizophila]